MMNDNSSLIVVDDVKKYYNDGEIKALDGVSTDIRKGELWLLLDHQEVVSQLFLEL